MIIATSLEEIYNDSLRYKIQQKRGEWLEFSRLINKKFTDKINILEIGSWDRSG